MKRISSANETDFFKAFLPVLHFCIFVACQYEKVFSKIFSFHG